MRNVKGVTGKGEISEICKLKRFLFLFSGHKHDLTLTHLAQWHYLTTLTTEMLNLRSGY